MSPEISAGVSAREEIDTLLASARLVQYSDYAESRRLALEALECSRIAGYAIGEGRSLQLIALSAYQMGDFDRASYQESIRILEEARDWSDCIKSMIFLAHALGRSGSFDEARALLDRGVVLAQQHNLPDAEALAHTHMGYIHARRKQLPKALEAFRRALWLFESASLDGRLALQGLGSVYRELKDFDRAIEYYERALAVTSDALREPKLISIGNIGLILEEAGRYQEAIEYLYRACSLAEEAHDVRNMFQLQSAIPRVHLLLDQTDEAIASLDKLFLLLHDGMEDIFQCAAYHSRADYYQHIHDWPKATADLEHALVFATRADNIEQLKTIYDALSICYRNTGNLEKALDFRDRYAKLVLDSMSSQLVERVSEMEAKHKQEEILRQNEIFRLKNIELQKANMALIDINKQKDKFISVLRHDLRNPIAAIIGYSNLLTLGDKAVAVDKAAHVIEESGKRMLRLMDDVTHSAKWGELIIERENVKISRLIADIEDIVQPLIESKDIKLTIKDESGGKVFSVDPNKLYQALTNLLFNAIKFTPIGKAIELKSYFSTNGSLNFILRDEGIGMPKDFIPRLFEGNAETQRQGTAGESGTGMGLTIAKNVIELHGGKMTIKSEEGVGTEIKIQIPTSWS